MNYPKCTDIILSTVTLTLTIFFFVPFSLYLLNKEAFFTSLPVVAGTLLAFSFFSFLLLSPPLLITKGMARVVALSILVFLTMAAWTQANLLNWDYGLLDGSALRWQLLERRTYIDITAWIILFVLVLYLGIIKKASFRIILLILLFMQGGSILHSWMTLQRNTSETDARNLTISNSDRFTFSNKKNIILIVLDAYESDIFNEYIEKNPDFKERLPGFVYYPNNVSEHFYTLRSIATLLTGNYLESSAYANGKAQKEHRNELLRNSSILALLKKSGYHTGLYPFYARNNYPPEIFGKITDNYVRSSLLMNEGTSELFSLMAVSLFRIAPHPFKKMIHNRFLLTPSYDQDRDEFSHDVQSLLKVELSQPSFKYYHLQGLHGPHIINGERLDADSRESAMNIAGLVNEMLANFVTRLQAMGVYDITDIFVVGDHGLYNDSESVVYGEFTPPDTALPSLDPFVKKCRAIPLFLHKPAGNMEPLQISKTPVCLVDVLPSVLNTANVEAEGDFNGISITTLPEDAFRLRRHFTSEAHRNRSVIPDYEFYVTGFSWHDASWTYTGNRHTYNTIDRVPLNNYIVGQRLTFGVSGNGKEYLDENWIETNNSHRMKANEAGITLPLANPTPGMILEMEVAPTDATTCEISVFINNGKRQTYAFTEATILKITAPYEPAWQRAITPAQNTEKKQGDDLWDWSPMIPVLSNALLNITLRQESSISSVPKNLEVLSLCIKSTAE